MLCVRLCGKLARLPCGKFLSPCFSAVCIVPILLDACCLGLVTAKLRFYFFPLFVQRANIILRHNFGISGLSVLLRSCLSPFQGGVAT